MLINMASKATKKKTLTKGTFVAANAQHVKRLT